MAGLFLIEIPFKTIYYKFFKNISVWTDLLSCILACIVFLLKNSSALVCISHKSKACIHEPP